MASNNVHFDKKEFVPIKHFLDQKGVNGRAFGKKNWFIGSAFTFYIPESEHSDDYHISFGDHAKMKDIVSIIKLIYDFLKVGAYGLCIDDNPEEYEFFYDKKGDLAKSRFWGVTLLTPEEVEKWGGREKCLGAPCEVIEEFEDGAILLIIGKEFISSSYYKRVDLRKYFGEKYPIHITNKIPNVKKFFSDIKNRDLSWFDEDTNEHISLKEAIERVKKWRMENEDDYLKSIERYKRYLKKRHGERWEEIWRKENE
jgi:hypothetical protein